MKSQSHDELCRKVLQLDNRIRAVALINISGDNLNLQIREDVVNRKLVPIGNMPRWGHVLGNMPWNSAENLERYFGEAQQAIFRFEKIDLCLIKLRGTPSPLADKLLLLTLEKGIDVFRLITKVEEITAA